VLVQWYIELFDVKKDLWGETDEKNSDCDPWWREDGASK
jgi:hypothetical protein